jgi:HD-GYP domain-containing protein (c-di-GMP phosphodiesterase class II)
VIGYELLSGVPVLAQAALVVHARHERWDGGGYPRGLAGEAIPLSSRILAVADTYDTMQRSRGFFPAPSPHDILAELRLSSGRHFDPVVVALFERLATGSPPSD